MTKAGPQWITVISAFAERAQNHCLCFLQETMQEGIFTGSNSALIKSVRSFKQLQGNKDQIHVFLFLLATHANKPLQNQSRVFIQITQETGLQLNLQQQAEVFPLGFTKCHVLQFLYCSRNLLPAIHHKACMLFLSSSFL